MVHLGLRDILQGVQDELLLDHLAEAGHLPPDKRRELVVRELLERLLEAGQGFLRLACALQQSFIEDGALWFGTYEGGVSRFDGQTWTAYTKDDGLALNNVQAIAVASDGALWFGTYGGGVSRFDGETWTTYVVDDGLADNKVYSVAMAPDGALWFGTGKGAKNLLGG